jgi:uncharacterized protein YaiI (UPF0178 family)
LLRIFVDADACPVKDEVYRVAKRCNLQVAVVSNARLRIPADPRLEMVVVTGHFDAADDWIVENVQALDIVVTADIPLASRCLAKGAKVLNGKGRVFTDASIGDALASREISAFLRDMGNVGGGEAPFDQRDRSRFLQHLDDLIQASLRGK